MADLLRKYKSLYSSTSNSFGTGEGVTITPASVVGLPTDTEIVLTFDRVDSGGTATPTKMERIKGTISGGNLTVSASGRGYDGSTEQAHTSPVVEMIWNAKDWNDMVDWGVTGHDQAGRHTTALTKIADTTTPSKLFAWQLSGATAAKTLTLISAHTDNRSVTLPDATDTLVGKATTDTLTNKRLEPRIVSAASYTTDTGTSLSVATADLFVVTAQAGALKFNNPGGTPVQGQKLMIRIKDDGTARALTYDTQFRALGTALPSTTVISKTLYIGFIYNSTDTKWDCVAAAQET